MKHIKLYENFEEFNNNELYKIIPSRYYFNYDKNKIIEFTNHQRNIINNILSDMIPTMDDIGTLITDRNINKIKYKNTNGDYNINILRCDDEIYFIEYYKYSKKNISSYGSLYLCDQFDGLLQCIKDKIILFK